MMALPWQATAHRGSDKADATPPYLPQHEALPLQCLYSLLQLLNLLLLQQTLRQCISSKTTKSSWLAHTTGYTHSQGLP